MQTQFLKYISLIKEKENKTLNFKEMIDIWKNILWNPFLVTNFLYCK